MKNLLVRARIGLRFISTKNILGKYGEYLGELGQTWPKKIMVYLFLVGLILNTFNISYTLLTMGYKHNLRSELKISIIAVVLEVPLLVLSHNKMKALKKETRRLEVRRIVYETLLEIMEKDVNPKEP